MSKQLFTLLFLSLFINPTSSQINENNVLFVGHAYGSHMEKDQTMDRALLGFIAEQKNHLFKKIIFGGDMIQNCEDEVEILNFIKVLDENLANFVIGNHDNCDKVIEIAKNKFGGLNTSETINNNLILYINTSIKSNQEVDELFNFIKTEIMNAKPNNVVIFSHQLFFSKSDFYVRVNSRKYYDYGNNLYDKIYNHFFAGDIKMHFFAGDIGAFPLTPYSFYDNVDNFNFYGVGLGNEKNHKAILIDMNNDIKVSFVDIKSYVIEPKEKYLKYKVQFYQFPKVILSYLKRNFIYVLAFLGFTVAFYLFKKRKI
jgi:hypothetical protein